MQANPEKCNEYGVWGPEWVGYGVGNRKACRSVGNMWVEECLRGSGSKLCMKAKERSFS